MDLSSFHDTVPTSTPLCSAQDITNLREMYRANHPETTETASVEKQQSPVAEAGNSEIISVCSDPLPSQDTTMNTNASDSCLQASCPPKIHRSQRSKSMQETTRPPNKERQRRCSLGDMIMVAQGECSGKRKVYANALNIYRHRRSVTDTYLGEEIEEEGDESSYDSSLAVLSIVSQISAEKRTDFRELLKRRRGSVQLCFGEKTGRSEDVEEDDGGETQTLLSVRSLRTPERRTDIRDVFSRRRSSVQLLFGTEPTFSGAEAETEALLEK